MDKNHHKDRAKNPNTTSPRTVVHRNSSDKFNNGLTQSTTDIHKTSKTGDVVHRTDSEHDKRSKISGEVTNTAEIGGFDLFKTVDALSNQIKVLNKELNSERDRNDQLHKEIASLKSRLAQLEITFSYERDRNRKPDAANPSLDNEQSIGSKSEKECKIKSEGEKEDSKRHTLPLESSQTSSSSSSKTIQQTDSTVKHSFGFPFMKKSDMCVCFELFHKNYIMHLDNKEDENDFIDEFSAIAREYVESCNTQSDCAQKEVQELLDEFDNVKIEFLSPFELTDCEDIAKSKQQSSNLLPESNETNSSSSSNTLQQIDKKVKHSLVFPFMNDSDIQVCFDYIHQSVETRWRYKKDQGMKFKNDVPKIANKYVETCKQLALGAQNKVRNLVDKCSKNITVEFLSPFKMKDLEEVVESVDKLSLKNVVYKFTCAYARCNKTYIGKTTQVLNKRANEHLRYKKTTAVYSHLESKVCRDACKVTRTKHPVQDLDYCKKKCFDVIDSAANDEQLTLKEALHIKWQRPDINKQEPRACLQLRW